MKYAVGIDLGSTTTKAVVLGEEGAVLGRGITNSRSNYDVACQVALSEAIINTRFSLIAGEFRAIARDPARAPALIAALERKFRAASIGPADIKGMEAFASTADRRFHRVVRLYTGREIVPFSANIHAMPVSALWRGAP